MANTDQATRKAYIIQESGWGYSDEYYYRGSADDQVVRAYTTRAKAEAFQRRKELQARRGKNPFEWGSFWSTSRTEEEFRRFVEDELRLPPPQFAHGCYQWMAWWSDHEAGMTAQQRRRIWDAMDLVHFFEVVEIDVEG
jgi:hypothetical protein